MSNKKGKNNNENEEKLKRKLKLNTILIIALIIVLAIIILVLVINNSSDNVNVANNLSNLGLVCEGDDYVFYYKYQEGIIKIKDGTEYQISDEQAYSLNYYDGYLYYITPNSNGGINIRKLASNGDTTETLVSTASSSTQMYLYNGYLYYLTSSPNTISKIDLNGENETVLLTRSISDFEIVGETIYFTSEFGYLYSIDLNGENYTEITTEAISSSFQIYKKYVYYYDEEQGLMRLNLNKLETELISDKVDSEIFNVTDKGIFFVSIENLKICKINLKGNSYEELVDINSSNARINIAGNYLYYIAIDEETSNYKTYRIKTNGKATNDIEY